jgi:voltage-gated potassium channel
MKKKDKAPEFEEERQNALEDLSRWLEPVMVALGFVWLVLLIIEIVRGLNDFLFIVGNIIWIIFILDFILEFSIAPRKTTYLKRNVLTAVSLVIPAFRIFRAVQALRLFRLAKATRTLRLVRLIASINRGMKALSESMARKGFGYVMILTLIITLTGAAGMHSFEKDTSSGHDFRTYGSSLWWTAMIMTTMGSQYWPQTTEGRMLCLFLALYAFAVFGYVTAAIATFFIGLDSKIYSPPKAKKDGGEGTTLDEQDKNE